MREQFISIGTIIIDDIVLPDGRNIMGVLGGGSMHAVMGMRVWCDHIGLFSGVGKDFDQNLLTSFSKVFDVNGLFIHNEVRTPRAWQVFDDFGTRKEIFQTNFDDLRALIPIPENITEKFSEISGVHLFCPPEDVINWASVLRKKNCQIILWEPLDVFCVPENLDLFRENCNVVDIVSPNLLEARHLTGLDDLEEIIRFFQEFGPPIVVLRMGEAGSLILDESGMLMNIDAYPVRHVVDVTGAGNAYCGGFVVGLFRTGSAKEAGWYGAVSASFALEQFGALYDLENINQRAEVRLRWYQENQ